MAGAQPFRRSSQGPTGIASNSHGTSGNQVTSYYCIALTPDGKDCTGFPTSGSNSLCSPCHTNYLKMYKEYKWLGQKFKNESESTGEEILSKIAIGEKIVELRRTVHELFFARSSDDGLGHLRMIRQCQEEVKRLKASSNIGMLSAVPPTQETNRSQRRTESVAVVQPEICDPSGQRQALLTKLYKIAPTLRETEEQSVHSGADSTKARVRNTIVQYFFREVAYALDVITPTTTDGCLSGPNIKSFLDCLSHEQLVKHVEYFERLNECVLGRRYEDLSPEHHSVLQLLRRAVRDAISDHESAVPIMGGRLTRYSEGSYKDMARAEWIALLAHFAESVASLGVQPFCSSFEDYCFISQLAAFCRHGSEAFQKIYEMGGISQRYPWCLMFDVVPLLESPVNPVAPSGCNGRTEIRRWAVGRMDFPRLGSIGARFEEELTKRVARYIVYFVGDSFWQSADIRQYLNTWIERKPIPRRTSPLNDDSQWVVTKTLSAALQESNLLAADASEMHEFECVTFVIVERDPLSSESGNLPGYSIFDDVSNILLQLSGRQSVPEIQRDFLRRTGLSRPGNACAQLPYGLPAGACLAIPETCYEGRRTRAWDISLNAFQHLARLPETVEDARLILSLVSDMLKNGIIRSSHLKDGRNVAAYPFLVRGCDNIDDVYFPKTGQPEVGDNSAATRSAPTSTLLKGFIKWQSLQFPGCLFAKGSIRTSYCAWPISAVKNADGNLPCFRTQQGHVFEWECLPFDSPSATNIWQAALDCHINEKFAFLRCVEKTVLISARDRNAAATHIAAVQEAAKRQGWTFDIPDPKD